MSSVNIIPYEGQYQAEFKRINEAWISKFFVMEEADYQALDHPEEKILNPGGAIVLAELGGKIVGTCALIKMSDDQYELAKMGVDENAQGHGIGYKLGMAVIEKAKELGGKKVYLETNSKLTPALSLYRKLGFVDVEDFPTPYERCNVQMMLDLSI
ncbi:MAG: GNAT family N-acetyltransferase [Bacteroidota bacterium]